MLMSFPSASFPQMSILNVSMSTWLDLYLPLKDTHICSCMRISSHVHQFISWPEAIPQKQLPMPF